MNHIFIINRKTLKNQYFQATKDISEICSSNGLTYHIHVTDSIDELKRNIDPYQNLSENSVFYAVGGGWNTTNIS